MAKPHTKLLGRKVRWVIMAPAPDSKVIYSREVHGYIMDYHWTPDGNCFFLVVDKDGRLYQKAAEDCWFPDSPISTPDAKFTQ